MFTITKLTYEEVDNIISIVCPPITSYACFVDQRTVIRRLVSCHPFPFPVFPHPSLRLQHFGVFSERMLKNVRKGWIF